MNKKLILVFLGVVLVLGSLVVLKMSKRQDESAYLIDFKADDISVFTDFKEVGNISRGILMYEYTYQVDHKEIGGFFLFPEKLSLEVDSPVIVFNRGFQQDREASIRNLRALAEFAEQGYVVFMADYSFSLEEQIEESHGLLEIIRQLSFVDPAGLHLLGPSHSGLLNMNVLRGQTGIRSAVVLSPIGDLYQLYTSLPSDKQVNYNQYLGVESDDIEGACRLYSPINWLAELRSPILFIQGSLDQNLDLGHVEALYDLMKTDHPVDLVVFEDDHTMGNHHSEMRHAILKWFSSH